MYRRALLATTAAVVVAGCVDGDSSDGGPEAGAVTDDPGTSSASGTTDTALETDPDAGSVVLTGTEPAEAGEASIEFAADAVHVEGTVLGDTGCHGVEIANTRTTDEGAFRVVVAAVDDADPGTLCTQALTRIGYEMNAAFTDGVPESVAVVHDDTGGREVVATASSRADE